MPVDLTTALGRLLADPALRAELRRDPETVARTLDADVGALRDLEVGDLDEQARTLIEKRFGEVSRRSPLTVSLLGARARALFWEHAISFWPEGHRRHSEDAAAFVHYLQERKLPHSRAELHRLRFSLETGLWSLRFVADAWVGGRP